MGVLYYQTSLGVGNYVNDEGDIMSCNNDLPKRLKDDNKEFTIFTFGHDINPKDAKSPLFRCRNMIAVLNCFYVGKDRGNMRAGHLDTACSLTDKLFNNCKSKELVVVQGLGIDADDEDAKNLFESLYSIVYTETKKLFNATDIVICLFVNDSAMKYIKGLNSLGSAFNIDEDNGAILLYL